MATSILAHWTSPIIPVLRVSGLLPFLITEIPALKANREDLDDQRPSSVMSDLGLRCWPMSHLWNARHEYLKIEGSGKPLHINKTKYCQKGEVWLADILQSKMCSSRQVTQEGNNRSPEEQLAQCKNIIQNSKRPLVELLKLLEIEIKEIFCHSMALNCQQFNPAEIWTPLRFYPCSICKQVWRRSDWKWTSFFSTTQRNIQCRWKIFPFLFFSPWTTAFFSRRNSKKLLPEEKNTALKRSRFHRKTPKHFTAKIDFPRRKKSWVQVSTGRPICTDSPCFSAKFCGVEFNG